MKNKPNDIHDSAIDESKIPSEGDVSQINELESQIEEWKGKYVRALADYQNLEKRTETKLEERQKFAAEVTLRKFLPAIDSLERAVKHIKDEGLALSLKEFQSALTSCGVKKMQVVGQEFDPFTMECIELVDGDDDKVIEELTSGYMYFDKVLRVAQVRVGRKSDQ